MPKTSKPARKSRRGATTSTRRSSTATQSTKKSKRSGSQSRGAGTGTTTASKSSKGVKSSTSYNSTAGARRLASVWKSGLPTDKDFPFYTIPPKDAELLNQAHANARQIGGMHYKRKSIQPWDAIVDWDLNFLAGNVVKYVARYQEKNGLQDLEKARHYLDKLIEVNKASAGLDSGGGGAGGTINFSGWKVK